MPTKLEQSNNNKKDIMEIKSTTKVCGGFLIRFSHKSIATNSVMTCAVFLPNGISRNVASDQIPSIMYLSGLTCTDENVCQKGYPFRKLSELNVFVDLFLMHSYGNIITRLHLLRLILPLEG